MFRITPTYDDTQREEVKVEKLSSNKDRVFVDANLYIPIHSFLEESIPSACKSCLHGLFGSREDRETAMRDIVKIMDYQPILKYSVSELETDAEVNDLVNVCMNHYTDLREYLKRLVNKWTEHTSDKYNDFRNLLSKTTRDMDDLERVRNKYVAKDEEFVSNEFVNRVSRLSEELEERMNEIRNSQPSSPVSRDRMHETGENVQRLFADMAKTVPTRKLQKVREFYENKMKECETEACKSFKERVEKWSKGLIY